MTSLWCTFVNPFLVVHPRHILVHPRMHRAHRLKSAVVEDGLIESSGIDLCVLVLFKHYSPNNLYFHELVSHPGKPEHHHFLFLV